MNKQIIKLNEGLAEAGLQNLHLQLSQWNLPSLPDTFDYALVLKEGRIAKRISKHYFKEHGIKLSQEQINTIGNLAHNYSTQPETFTIDITQDFNWHDGDFGDSGSCFWSYNRSHKDTLHDLNASAIRFFRDDNTGFARAWIIPIDNDTDVLINGYGMQTRDIAFVYAKYTDRKHVTNVDMENYESLYINGPSGYVVSLEPYKYGSLELDLETNCIHCEDCGTAINPDFGKYEIVSAMVICQDCFDKSYGWCEFCEENYHNDDLHHTHDHKSICSNCLNVHVNDYYQCEDCEEIVSIDDTFELHDGTLVCCYCSEVEQCEQCDEYFYAPDITNGLCEDCQQEQEQKQKQEHIHTSKLCLDCKEEKSVTGELCLECAYKNHVGWLLYVQPE